MLQGLIDMIILFLLPRLEVRGLFVLEVKQLLQQSVCIVRRRLQHDGVLRDYFHSR